MPHQVSCSKQPTLLNDPSSSRIIMLLSTIAMHKAVISAGENTGTRDGISQSALSVLF